MEERKREMEIFDNIPTQVWCLIDEERCTIVNQTRADYFGLNKEDLENRPIQEIMATEEEASISIANNRDVFSRKTQTGCQEWSTNGKGKKRLLYITRTPQLDASGTVEYVICYAEDITEQKELEDELQKRGVQLNAILQSTEDGILAVDNEGKILAINNRFLELWRIPGEILQSGVRG